jgi:hypothetical protein
MVFAQQVVARITVTEAGWLLIEPVRSRIQFTASAGESHMDESSRPDMVAAKSS